MTGRKPIKASDLLVKALENEGVEYIFGVPGEENLDFLESLRTSSIKLILTRHEQGASFMAATYGRLTGKVGRHNIELHITPEFYEGKAVKALKEEAAAIAKQL